VKIYCASIDHETNRFSPIPTSLQSYREGFLYRPATGEGQAKLDFALEGVNLASLCKARGHDVHFGIIAATHPSAPTTKTDYELLRDELLDALRNALPVDCVALRLHGAMVAEGYDDCEGDILEKIRQTVGKDTPVAVLFDLHGNITQKMTDNATLLCACKEYPHIDFDDRALDMIKLLEKTVTGQCRPVMAHVPVPMTGIFHTTRQPLRGLVDKIIELESKADVLSVSLTHGFIWADFEGVGAGAIVITDGDLDQAEKLAEELADEFFSIRDEIDAPLISLNQALAQLKAYENEGPIVLADVADNPGGGGAGDSTHLLRALIDHNIAPAAVGIIWDPQAVVFAHYAGVGAVLPLRIGGKMGPLSGKPVDLKITVKALTDDLWQWAMGVRDPLGQAALVESNGIEILLVSTRQQVLSPECFTNLGVTLERQKVIVVKSAHHFHATFAPLAREILYVDLPGTVSQNYTSTPYSALPEPLWPFQQPPFYAFGKNWPASIKNTGE